MHPLCCSAMFRGLKTPVYLVHSTASSKTPKPPQPHPKISCLTCGTSFLYYSASPKSPESRGLLFQGKQKSFLMGSDLGQEEVSQWQILLSDLWLNSGFRFFFSIEAFGSDGSRWAGLCLSQLGIWNTYCTKSNTHGIFWWWHSPGCWRALSPRCCRLSLSQNTRC